MVFPDLSAPETQTRQPSSAAIPIAAVSDRLLAFVLDFLIFSPVVSLLIAGLVRQTRTYFLLSPTSQEAPVAAGLVFLAIVFIVTLLQSLFLFYWQATPGQFFLQLRVVSYPHEQERLSLNQCLIRAFLWCGGFMLLAIPYLEIVSHPLRRAFHERASDTLVITLKKNPDEGPHPLESRFIASWLRMSFLLVLLMGVLSFFKTYQSLLAGDYREKEVALSFVCKEMKETDLSGVARLDAALSLFMLNEISAECLDKEAEASLWGDPVNSQELAYLAKYLVSEGDAQENYFAKVCAEATSSACAIARYMHEDKGAQDLEQADSKLWLARVLLSEEKYSSQDYQGSLKLIEELQKVPELKRGLEKRYVRSIWALYEGAPQDKGQGRMPASSTPVDSWIEDFKEKYEVP